jgi:hypothetical protein
MGHENTGLVKAVLVQEQMNPLPGRQSAGLVNFFDSLGPAAQECLLSELAELSEFSIGIVAHESPAFGARLRDRALA